MQQYTIALIYLVFSQQVALHAAACQCSKTLFGPGKAVKSQLQQILGVQTCIVDRQQA